MPGRSRPGPRISIGASQTTITKAGGWVTPAIAVLAWYHAVSDIIAGTFGRRMLTVWPLKEATTSCPPGACPAGRAGYDDHV